MYLHILKKWNIDSFESFKKLKARTKDVVESKKTEKTTLFKKKLNNNKAKKNKNLADNLFKKIFFFNAIKNETKQISNMRNVPSFPKS